MNPDARDSRPRPDVTVASAAPAAESAPGPAPAAAAPAPPGPLSENLLMGATLACDLLVTPLHLAAFLATRGRQRRALLQAIEAAAAAPPPAAAPGPRPDGATRARS